MYTKLYVFGLEAFSRVIYLDADTVVARNIDHLFACGDFCAVLRHSERFNSGVMVITPSAALLKDMLGKTDRTPSYTGCVNAACRRTANNTTARSPGGAGPACRLVLCPRLFSFLALAFASRPRPGIFLGVWC